MKLFSYRGDLVLDPFNGAGTTTRVARALGRRFIGIDASREYRETALQRTYGGEGVVADEVGVPGVLTWNEATGPPA